jgi:[lysine-biosynthesis-protein LysW]---L-2-aminoadipate ligase
MRAFAVVAHAASPTNVRLGPVLAPAQALTRLRPGDVALGRIDVLRTLDGIESGLWALDLLERRGVTVLNRRASLVRSHDKLATARALAVSGVSHPGTWHVAPWLPLPELEYPVVLKPRFGSWGRDVVACATRAELVAAFERARARVWFNATGGVVQSLVDASGCDLRLLVAGGQVVGAVHRVAAAGEWRTNVALGACRLPAAPPQAARLLALAAAEVVGGDLLGVDLLPLRGGGFTVIEVNGAVDFTRDYSLDRDVFEAVHGALGLNASVAAPLVLSGSGSL